MNIALIIGSLSQKSINRSVANYIVSQFPADVKVTEVRIDDLPLYTQDRDQVDVPEYDRVREQIKNADAVLIVSPEHNRAMPAATKNIIDIASRPYGRNLWQGKKVAIVTASPGAYGGINSGLQIRQSLQSIGTNVLTTAEVFLSKANQALDEQGEVADERTAGFLSKFAQTFIQWAKA